MKKEIDVFDSANQYVKESDWKTIAALKLCVLSMGILIGMGIPQKHKAKIVPLCTGVYGATVVPLMKKFVDILRRS